MIIHFKLFSFNAKNTIAVHQKSNEYDMEISQTQTKRNTHTHTHTHTQSEIIPEPKQAKTLGIS